MLLNKYPILNYATLERTDKHSISAYDGTIRVYRFSKPVALTDAELQQFKEMWEDYLVLYTLEATDTYLLPMLGLTLEVNEIAMLEEDLEADFALPLRLKDLL